MTEITKSSSAPARPRARRSAQQSRSREKVQAILEAARTLIGERGNDAVSVREIAAKASVPIASVYDYFPDKNAILRELMVGYMGRILNRMATILVRAETPEQLPGTVDEMVDAFVALFREEKELATIWSAVQANTTLRELDVEDGQRIAEFMIARFRQIVPGADPEGIRDACTYAVYTIATTVRVAVYTNPKEGDRLIREFKQLMQLRLQSLIRDRASV